MYISEPKHQQLSATRKPQRALKLENLVAFGALPAAAVMFLGSVPLGAMYAFLAIYAGGDGTSLFFLTFATISLLLRAFGGSLCDRFGRRLVAIPSLASIAISMGVVALSANIAVVIFAAVLFGLGWGLMYPAVLALAADGAPEQRGAAIGTFSAAMDASFMVAMISLGVVAQGLGYPSVFLIAGASAFVGLLYLTAYRRPRGRGQALTEVA